MKLPRHEPNLDNHATGERHYLTPLGRLPSVTTVLQATEYKPGLEHWRRDRRAASAARVSSEARARGAAFHKEMEQYFNTGRPEAAGSEYFESVRPFLRRVSEVALVEGAAWHSVGFAGCVDCVAVVDGILSVIDWKTARTLKQDHWVVDEHLQVTAYRAAVQELYGVQIARALVVFAFADDDAQVFETPTLDRQWETFVRRLKTYQER